MSFDVDLDAVFLGIGYHQGCKRGTVLWMHSPPWSDNGDWRKTKKLRLAAICEAVLGRRAQTVLFCTAVPELTTQCTQRAREISKLSVRHTRSKAQDSAVMHGLCRSDAVGHTKNEATSRRCLRSEQGRRTATVLCCTARFEQTQLSPQRARENQPLTAPADTPFVISFRNTR